MLQRMEHAGLIERRQDPEDAAKPFHTLHPGMECWKEKHLARWNDAELQSARRGRRVICRLSHVRESKQRHGFRGSKMSPIAPTFIVSPPVYWHTVFLDVFFGRCLPYTQMEAIQPWHTCGESSPFRGLHIFG
jgi:hypothetical protein